MGRWEQENRTRNFKRKMLKNETQQTFLNDYVPTSYIRIANTTLNLSLETNL